MRIHDVQQGSEAWLALKENYDSASEASVMMGCSKNMSRDDLLKYKATGQKKEISKYTEEVIFPDGHRVEALAQPFAVEFIGQDLYPVVGSDEETCLLASFDGLTMDWDIVWECKQWNESKAAIVRSGEIPEEDIWQVRQALVVSRAKKCLYTISDGTKENTLHHWYMLTPSDEKRLLAGWKQFNEDLANYKYIPEPELITAEPVMDLPAVSIRVDGEIALIDNLSVFGEALQQYIDGLNLEPEDDQDFANLEAAVKTLKKAEDALTAAENNALAQTASIDEMRRTVELNRELARRNRLMAEKLVKSKKEEIRVKMIDKAQRDLSEHVRTINTGLGDEYMPEIKADFRAAIKGKKTIASLQSSVNDELARAKIEANELAEKVRANLASFKAEAEGYIMLFVDLKSLVLKDTADFTLTIRDRVAKHKQQEEEKLQAERERIREEETARIKAENTKEADEELEILDADAMANSGQKAALTLSLPDYPKDPFSGPIWVVHVTDKELAAQAIVRGDLNTEIDDLIINVDRLTERAYKLNGNLSIPGIKIVDEKES
ncbi:MAG: YqaJ viral recombinase family protein [Anaerolineales bacterium]